MGTTDVEVAIGEVIVVVVVEVVLLVTVACTLLAEVTIWVEVCVIVVTADAEADCPDTVFELVMVVRTVIVDVIIGFVEVRVTVEP